MKKIFINQLETFRYMKISIVFSFCVYLVGVFIGGCVFWNKKIKIHPMKINSLVILNNNIKTAVLILFIGLITAGIGSTLLMLINGGILGGTILGAINLNNFNAIKTGIVPHAGFEIMALCLFMAVSLESNKLLRNIFLDKKEEVVHIKYDIIAIADGIILLIIAALIEGNISYVR